MASDSIISYNYRSLGPPPPLFFNATLTLKILLEPGGPRDKANTLLHYLIQLQTTEYFFACSIVFLLPMVAPPRRLSSIEKFSRFSRFMESTVQTIHLSCTHLTTMNSDAVTCLSMLGRDFQRFSTGRQPASGAWIVGKVIN